MAGEREQFPCISQPASPPFLGTLCVLYVDQFFRRSNLTADGDIQETLCDALMDTGLIGDMEVDLWTVFAPTNEAFEELGSEVLDSLSNDTAILTDLLLFHTVAGAALKSDDLPCTAGDNLILMANGQESRT